MGITVWVRRTAHPPVAAAPPGTPAGAGAAPDGPQSADWERLASLVEGCTRCPLHRGRTRTVFGVGDRTGPWMVVGEAPGAEEDRRGEPFVGRAGQLLDRMLAAIGLVRGRGVYIANVLKCRPPDNRDPLPEEAAACRPYLERQLALVAPRVVLAVGRIAAQNLLGTAEGLGRLRGRVHRLPGTGVPVVVTYHPAYLLRSPQQKRRAWEDLCLARRVAAGEAGP
ncbi:DNA polymerase [Inmirania thermothiophila]|uniref:Type-4 uracil-DNA glycosylase n=2 Tax=Inmirania thermothiophila TaxID=1750597 RepID=A0A3N1Y8H0_9GAMM|nr:DNA polymerase [Inmirania thermothiophila]